MNISTTYDFENKTCVNNWGVSFGIGFGNSARGIGFNVGYGSSGFNYGMGEYYNSRAWDSNPTYNPEFWNTDCEMLENNNCYTYMKDDPFNTIPENQPGDYCGRRFECFDIDGIVSASLADGNLKRLNFLNKLGFGKRGYYSVYLCLDLDLETNYGVVDYHWYRQDKGGFWSQKHGLDIVTNVDGAGRLIRNPARANQFYGSYANRYGNYVGDLNYRNGGIFLWAKKR